MKSNTLYNFNIPQKNPGFKIHKFLLSIRFIPRFLNTLKLFTPLDGAITITLFIWLYYSKSNDQRRMSAERKEKRSVCEKEVHSWRSQELAKIVQKSFFCPCTT